MNLSAIADHLQSSGVAVTGTSMFLYQFPATVKSGLLITDRDGRGDSIQPYDTIRDGGFRIISRGPTFAISDALMAATIAAMKNLPKTLGGMEIKSLIQRNEPVYYPRTDANITEGMVVFDAFYGKI